MSEVRRKLIEVALPLEAINKESARRKRKAPAGYPTTMHKWWAQRPLAACRAVLFAQLVDDPSSWPDLFPTEESQDVERERLFRIIEELVLWENSTNEAVLLRAQTEIAKCLARVRGENPPTSGKAVREYLTEHGPTVLDPFCGGGSIPLEAQRLGLKPVASDLNPIAVLITTALIEIPPRFAGMPPVNPEARRNPHMKTWPGAQGLADDVRYYGRWVREEAEKRIGHLYPKVRVSAELIKERQDLEPYAGQELTVIAWLWARTIRCPNPACRGSLPLVRSFVLSSKKGKEAWIDYTVEGTGVQGPDGKFGPGVGFFVKTGRGTPPNPPKTARGAKFRCLCCGQDTEEKYVKAEGMAKRMGAQLMAVVAEGERGRVYLPPTSRNGPSAAIAQPHWVPEDALPYEPRAVWCTLYGLTRFADLFTQRQLVALSTFTDLVGEVRERAQADASSVEALRVDHRPLSERGLGARAYADAIATYIAFAVSRLADYGCTISTWRPKDSAMRSGFSKQGIPMTWDYAEGSPFGDSSAGFMECVSVVATSLSLLPACNEGAVSQLTAAAVGPGKAVVCTDPPYYDNIGYADLSDFFYVWLRRSLGSVFPQLFATVLTPKALELIASPYRHNGDTQKAERFFEEGFRAVFGRLCELQRAEPPLAVFYAFKQSETEEDGQQSGTAGIVSTGWETMLEGLIGSGLGITATWPLSTEGDNRQAGQGANALASSVVLACRPRAKSAPLATRREFLAALRAELPKALHDLQHGNIAPVDLAQAAIGPGMAVFTRYAKVMEADGSAMSVRTALAMINQSLDEVLAEQEGEFDADTRWALAWFEQQGVDEGPFGVAETLSKAKNTAVGGLVDAGILQARGGKVRLLRREELLEDWDPATDRRFTVWEAAQYLIRALDHTGEEGAATLLRALGGVGETARDLAYRLYSICERKKWSTEALAYNSLVIAWPEIVRLSQVRSPSPPMQGDLFGNE